MAAADGRQRVLLIDDDERVLELYKKKLAEAGFEVSLVRDGNAAIENARILPPDVIVLDIIMPGMNGFEVLRAIRSDSLLKRTPVVISTSRKDPEYVIFAGQLGVQGYVVKSGNVSALVEAVRGALRPRAYPTPLPPPTDTNLEDHLAAGQQAEKEAPIEEPGPELPRSELDVRVEKTAELPQDVVVVTLTGRLEGADVDGLIERVGKQVDTGRPKIVLELNDLKWTAINADHINDVVEGARGRGAVIRIVTRNNDVRQSILWHRIRAPVMVTRREAIAEF